MMELLFKVIGAIGILLISSGVLDKKRLRGNTFHLFGGICLELYSVYIQDLIFIVLQAIFIVVVSYKIVKLRRGI